jgi:transcriptional regulator with XRE-family HTH domain
MTVNQKIRILRKEQNMTVTELAKKVGVFQSVLTRYEKGTIQYVPVDLIQKLADALGCKPDDLTEGDERYSQKKKKRKSREISSEEYEMILHFRQLPDSAKQVIKEICNWQISPN